MNAFALHEPAGRRHVGRWTLSAAAIVAMHVGLIAAAVAWYQQASAPGAEMPAIMVEMSPSPAAPSQATQDLAPGPAMKEAQPEAEPPPRTAPEPAKPSAAQQAEQMQQAQTLPLAPRPDAVVPAPVKEPAKPELTTSAPPKPEAAKAETRSERPSREEVRPRPPRREKKLVSRDPPAPRTTAPPMAERRGAERASPNAGSAAAAAALPSYRDRLVAHLARFKQYPSASKAAGEQGTAMLSFTVGRSGQVLGSRLARSSGHPSLDAETMAMIRRAQPLPSFPPEITQSSLSYTVPVNFSLR